MGSNSVRGGASHDFHRASRKAEEAALRRYEAVHWLECVVGPLGIPSQPSEGDFISCLRNGILLCNVINIIQPSTISKIVDNHVPAESEYTWDLRPLPAYQYFENVRNFLKAVEELKLPAFEASDLERENIEAGSAARIADCILALKSYHEWKQWSGGKGVYKHVNIVKSPLILHSAAKNFSRPSHTEAEQPCRKLDMSPVDSRQSLTESLVKALSEHMVDSKENMNRNFATTFEKGNQDPVQIFSDILSRRLEEKLRNKFPALNLQGTSGKTGASHPQLTSILQEKNSPKNSLKCSSAESRKRRHDRRWKLHSQEKKLKDIKALWSKTKSDFIDLENQLMSDLNHLGSLVEDMSSSARGYQKVIQENRKLYNMVQDLKGNIRVYCRIRPMLAEAKNIVSYQDDTLVLLDPSKPRSEGRKDFQFNRVYGPMVTQAELFKDTQPLIRSVMDGFNVCILAYGQTGSGKTYTMYGPSSSSEKETGINFFALNALFQTVHSRKDIIAYEVHVQMVEICNEQIRDLLADVSAVQDESSIPNIKSYAVKSDIEAISLVKQGKLRHTGDKSMGSTNLQNSSHSVVTVHVQGKDLSGKMLRSRLHLVDLAGSGEGDESISCLEDAITSLSQKTCNHSRQTKLTSLLQDVLGGKAKILVFAHVTPDGDSFTSTVSTLKFAQTISTIELGAAQSNKENSEVIKLKNEIENLKNALGDKTGYSPQPTKQPKSPCDKARITPQRTPAKSRRLSMENQGNMTSDKVFKSPIQRPKTMENQGNMANDKLPKSPIQRPKTPVKLRRLSMENQGNMTSNKLPKSPIQRPKTIENQGNMANDKLPKSPIQRPKIMENQGSVTNDKLPKSPIQRQKIMKEPTQRSLRTSVEIPGAKKNDTVRDAGTGSYLERSVPRDRRLSIENPMIIGSEKQHKSPYDGKKGVTKLTPPKTRRLSIENQTSVKPDLEHRKGTKTPPQLSLPVAKLSLEGPKDKQKEIQSSPHVRVSPKTPLPSYPNAPTFTDCAAKYPLETQEQQYQYLHVNHQQNITTQIIQTPEITKSTNGKRSQIKKSLRSIGKLINGSEKRNQRKHESISTTSKNISVEAKSPPSSRTRDLRRQSLTNIPPPGTIRRTSLGGMSNDARPSDNRNAKTPPSVRSSTNSAKRWM
ncbi:hypothetical protein vseg_007684 [Gypsophila vaccaria]